MVTEIDLSLQLKRAAIKNFFIHFYDLEDLFSGGVYDDRCLIVKADMGFDVQFQCGGLACHQNKYEGRLFDLHGMFGDDIIGMDCSYMCWTNTQKEKEEFINFIKPILIEETKDEDIQLIFDDSRISELKEGWWPVIVNSKKYGFINAEGFLHLGNCD